MALDTRAILGVQNVNALQSLQAGQMGMQAHDFGRKNALDQLISQNAGGLMNGDASALAALAGHGADGLQMANGMQQQQIANARADRQEALMNRREDRLDQQFKFQIADALRSAETQQIAAEQQQIAGTLKSLAVVHAEGDPAKFNTVAQQMGAEGVTFDNFPMHAAQTEEVYDLYQGELERRAGPSEMDTIRLNRERVGLESDLQKLDNLRNPQADPAAAFETATDLRKEWNGIPAVKAFSEQAQAYGRIQASAQDPSPAGDLAMIFNFMKVLDPGSVVRESEFATAAQASAWLQQSEEAGMTVPRPVAAAIRSMATGQRLSVEQRMDFARRATALYENAEANHMGLREQYTGIAERNQISVQDALPDFRYTGNRVDAAPQPPAAPAAPQAQMTPEMQQLYDKYATE